jgi:hypothetical protein
MVKPLGPLVPQLGACRNTLQDRRSLPNKRIGILGTSRNEWQKWSFPHFYKVGENMTKKPLKVQVVINL